MRTKLRCSMSTRRVLFDTGVPVWSYGYAYVNRYPRAQIYTCAMVHSYHACTHTCTSLNPLTHQLTDAWRSCVSSYSTTEYVSHGLLYSMLEPAEKAHSGSRWQIGLSKRIFATQFIVSEQKIEISVWILWKTQNFQIESLVFTLNLNRPESNIWQIQNDQLSNGRYGRDQGAEPVIDQRPQRAGELVCHLVLPIASVLSWH